MSKTFNNNDKNDARTLEVDRLYGGARLTIIDANRKGFLVADADAPALALAILEAAGYDRLQMNLNLRDAMDSLEASIEEESKRTAEAKEQAELEAEALELFNVNQGINLPDWGKADRAVISSWVRVARRARELAKEATK